MRMKCLFVCYQFDYRGELENKLDSKLAVELSNEPGRRVKEPLVTGVFCFFRLNQLERENTGGSYFLYTFVSAIF